MFGKIKEEEMSVDENYNRWIGFRTKENLELSTRPRRF
jgi:hypothetical protein